MNTDPITKDSPLSQALERDGCLVQIEIFDDGNDAWLLEVVDKYGNSTVWNDSFTTDRAALDEVMRAVADGGIQSLIGSAPADKL